ncbi:MAG: septum formation initiator family protein [Pseudomonadota bacterium]
MKRLWQKYMTVRQHFAALVGLCLCFYFCYHLVSGERSYLRLLSLNNMIATTKADLTQLRDGQGQMAHKVTMMRPGQVNADMLEEQAKITLGYRYAGENDVLPEGTTF